MKLKKLCLLSTVLLLAAGSVRAQNDPVQTQNKTDDRYAANEFSVDLFGGYSKNFQNIDDLFDHTWRHGDWGGGFGANYFFLRYVGIGADTFMYDDGKFWKNVSGNIYLRIPINCTGLAPYVYGGGGREFAPNITWSYGVGVGLEYRFDRHVGIFIDDRYYWADKGGASDRNQTRAGFRLVF